MFRAALFEGVERPGMPRLPLLAPVLPIVFVPRPMLFEVERPLGAPGLWPGVELVCCCAGAWELTGALACCAGALA